MSEIKETVRQFILEKHLPGESPEHLGDNLPLRSSGILDSLAALELIMFVQQEFGVELDVYDTSVERFDSIDDIATSVARKREQGTTREIGS